MFAYKNKYFLIIENTKDIDLKKIKKRGKFVIIYRNARITEKINSLKKFRKDCRLKQVSFYIANDLSLAINLKSDGMYLSSHNRGFKSLNFRSFNFDIIGSAHDIKEVFLKKKQGCKNILFSRLFRVSYKPEMSYMGLNRFNSFVLKNSKKIVPLGGIKLSNLNKMKSVNSEGFALMSEIKKKPANIINRLF